MMKYTIIQDFKLLLHDNGKIHSNSSAFPFDIVTVEDENSTII